MGNNDTNKRYTHRFLARVVIEATTPLSIGSGEKDIMSDHLVARDVNGLPYIPGTAIAGILRHAIGEEKAKIFFGYQEKASSKGGKKGQKESTGEGSQVIFSSAQLVKNKEGEVVEGLVLNVFKDAFLQHFKNLLIRQHVRINEKGAAVKGGKFDEEVVYKGTRFCFEIEMLSENGANQSIFDEVLSHLASDTLCIGSGTRSGHGEFKIIACKTAYLDLTNPNVREAYIQKTSSLNDSYWSNQTKKNVNKIQTGWTTYELKLQPDDFFLFGSGLGNEKADMTPVAESVVVWEGEDVVPRMENNYILIPGSSVKGALSHRVAFHYNKIKKFFIGNPEAKTGIENKAVKTLFGYTSQDEKEAVRGNVIISDVIKKREHEKPKILNHVSIDRFTGGAIDGALFTEEVTYGKGETYSLIFKVKNKALDDKDIKQAFEDALFDIAEGLLPLGGGTNRGHGSFEGKVLKNNNEIKRNEQAN